MSLLLYLRIYIFTFSTVRLEIYDFDVTVWRRLWKNNHTTHQSIMKHVSKVKFLVGSLLADRARGILYIGASAQVTTCGMA